MVTAQLPDRPHRDTRLFVIVGVLAIVLLLVCAFYVTGQYTVRTLTPKAGTGSGGMSVEKYLSEIIDFYKTIISIQFAVIAAVLVIAFIYVRSLSIQQARDMAIEAMDSISFQHDLDHRHSQIEGKLKDFLQQQWLEYKNSSDLEKLRGRYTKLRKRVAFVEEVMNDYTAADGPTGLKLNEPDQPEKGAL